MGKKKNYTEAVYVCSCGNVMESSFPYAELQCPCGKNVPRIHDCECAGKRASFAQISSHYSKYFKAIGVWKIDLDNPMFPLDHPKNRHLQSRCMYLYAVCPQCKGFMSSGTSFCDYRATGYKLVEEAIKQVMRYRPFLGSIKNFTKDEAREIVHHFLLDEHKYLIG